MVLLMPAWTGGEGSFLGCKIVTVFPDNAKLQRPSIYGSYMLMSGETGEPLAVMDGTTLTAWRTACASALAASYLAREDAAHLVMIGAGALAPHLVRAHASVRPIRRVTLWNRTRKRAVQTAFGLSVGGLEVEVSDDLEAAVREADIVSCATLSATPLVRGKWLKKGAHVDLVGAYTPKMRESDDDAIRKSRVYVDTRAGALEGRRRHRAAAEVRRAEEGRHPRRPVRALPRRGQGPQRQPADHAVQVGRHRDRGSGGRDAGVAGSAIGHRPQRRLRSAKKSMRERGARADHEPSKKSSRI